MNVKTWVGILIFVCGIVMILFGMEEIHKFAIAKGLSQDVENFLTKNPKWWNGLIEFFGGTPQQAPPKYSATGYALLITGIIVSLFGAVITTLSWKKK